MSGINFAAFGGINGVGSIRGLLATKKFAKTLRLKRDAIHAIGEKSIAITAHAITAHAITAHAITALAVTAHAITAM